MMLPELLIEPVTVDVSVMRIPVVPPMDPVLPLVMLPFTEELFSISMTVKSDPMVPVLDIPAAVPEEMRMTRPNAKSVARFPALLIGAGLAVLTI